MAVGHKGYVTVSDGPEAGRVIVMECECLRDCDVPTALAGSVMRGLFFPVGRLDWKLENCSTPPYHAAYCILLPCILVPSTKDVSYIGVSW